MDAEQAKREWVERAAEQMRKSGHRFHMGVLEQFYDERSPKLKQQELDAREFEEILRRLKNARPNAKPG